MIIYDFEVFKYDWLVRYLDTKTRKMYGVVNSKENLQKMYEKYKDQVWVGYNSRGYDRYITKGILCDFNPYLISKHIIDEGKQGWEYSNLFRKFPILNYDTKKSYRSLKELEAFMGNDIRESNVPFNIDRPLTEEEIKEVGKYCEHDVSQTFEVLIETASDFETIVALLEEFNLPLNDISKTKAQLASKILGATKRNWNDEHDIQIAKEIKLEKYDHVREWFLERAENKTDFKDSITIEIEGVNTKFAWGGVHGAKPKYFGDGFFVLSDINSMYPSMMIEFDLISRNIHNKQNYISVYHKRFELKDKKDSKQKVYKEVMNIAYGASLDKYNDLYDPRNGRSVCVNGQLALLMLIERVSHMCELVNINTDGILVKLHREEDFEEYKRICDQWEKETRLGLGHDFIKSVYQKDVNNAIFVHRDDEIKAIGAYVKAKSRLDNDLPIVREAIVDYLIKGVPVEKTIGECDNMIDFQKICKIGSKYEYVFKEDQRGEKHSYFKLSSNKKTGEIQRIDEMYYGKILNTKVNRVFASKLDTHGKILKKHKTKTSLDKIGGTPEKCFTFNSNVNDMKVPDYLDKQWYIDLAKQRIKDFIGE